MYYNLHLSCNNKEGKRFMASINDTISGWRPQVVYPKYGIASGEYNRYFYSLKDVNLNNDPVASLNGFWDGYVVINSNYVPEFYWKPSYSTVAQASPRINRVKFGNGYEQRIPDGMNTDLITLNLEFANRKESETVAILHFLDQMNGQISFIYNVPTIYNKSSFNTRFICPSWETTYNFYQNYSVKATFEEVAA
jgi:phage-related protein